MNGTRLDPTVGVLSFRTSAEDDEASINPTITISRQRII
ncbi:conserved hypothetical protein [Burkholderia pseudomallei MSHR346]|nr:conserved hypothetical protein [Burkholderia pseudomallei MSHR346]